MLYQLSYWGIINGSGSRIRTCDLWLMRPTKYRAFPSRNRWTKMVEGAGFEPATSPLSGVRSNQLSYTSRKRVKQWIRGLKQGVLRYKMEPEDRLELTTLWLQIRCSTNWATPAKYLSCIWYTNFFSCQSLFKTFYGVTSGAWTRDIRNHNPTLYQLSYGQHCVATSEGIEPPWNFFVGFGDRCIQPLC